MVKVFVEGGGRGSRPQCQRGFSRLLAKAARGCGAMVVACGPRGDAFRKFRGATGRGEKALLLVDGEGPVAPQNFGRPWTHLDERDNWQKPDGASDDHAHLMAQCMESWLVADPGALEDHFGPGFKAAKLPQNPEVEEVAKSDILSGLASAARETRNGGYDKVRDGFALIGIIDPVRVAKRARHAGRFFGVLRQESGARKGKE